MTSPKNISAFDDEGFVNSFLHKRDQPQSLNNLLDTPSLMDLLGCVDGKRILELGCGAGRLAEHFVGTDMKQYVGTDLSTVMLQSARSKVNDPRVQFIQTDIQSDALPPGPYDCAVSGLTLHFLRDINWTLSHLREALVPGGTFVFSVRHPIRTANPGGIGGDRASWTVSEYFVEGSRAITWHGRRCHIYHRTISSWLDALTANGFVTTALREPHTAALELLDEDADHQAIPGFLLFRCSRD